MKRIIECIPNFSEGRRQPVIDAITGAIGGVDGVRVLNVQTDADHNRMVVTFVGEPEAVAEGAFQGIKTAGELIDLNHHSGEHPRLGAADVVPLVPIQGVTMAECVATARQLGARVGEELGIPVYLYEEAATVPERCNLADVRRGEYEALKVDVLCEKDRSPDFGPAACGPAGATIIGARQFLIAYNVFLTTDDLNVAKEVARAVRHSSGGLRYVKALGMLVEGKAQVSMNLTNFERTPVYRVVELIRREAARYGVDIERSELIGMIPQQALLDAAQWYLQLDGFDRTQVLEIQLNEHEG